MWCIIACREVNVPDAAQTPGAEHVFISNPLSEHSNTGSRAPEKLNKQFLDQFKILFDIVLESSFASLTSIAQKTELNLF